MGLETGTYIDSLVATNPVGTDAKSQGDDHIRLVKSTVKATFPNISGAVTPTHTELNYVDGVTSAIQTQLDSKGTAVAPTAWTPVLKFGGATTGITYSTQTGYYTKVGRLITVCFDLRLSNKGSATGDMSITGLPFNTAANTVAAGAVEIAAVTHAGTVIVRTSVSELYIASTSVLGVWATLTDADFSNSSSITGSVTYQSAS